MTFKIYWMDPDKISEVVGLNQQKISQITNNTNLSNIGNLLTQGHDNMDLALAWALRLEGKTDQERFKALGWGLRTWPVTKKPDGK